MNNNNYDIMSMRLNSQAFKDTNFNSKIRFIVEKYIENDIPVQIQCKDLHNAIIQAYKLFQTNELHSILILDSKGNCNGTNALNYFLNKDIVVNNLEHENKMLQYENDKLKEFLKNNNLLDKYRDFRR